MAVEEILEPQPSEMINEMGGLPAGTAPVEEPAPVEAAVEPAPEPAPEGTVEVEGQKFATEADAFEFLKGQYGNIKTEQMISEARLQGMQEAMQYTPQGAIPQAVAPEAVPEIDMDKFYENPGKYMAERDAAIEERLMGKVGAQQAQAQRDAQVWGDFTSAHPDLADFRQDVEAVAESHRDTVMMLAKRDNKKAMDFVALKVREKFQRYAEVMKPTRTLSNAKVQSIQGSNPGVTSAQNVPGDSEGLDMISQMRKMRKK
jgi:hypothetical protein